MFEGLIVKFLVIVAATVPAVFLLFFVGKGWYRLRKQPIPNFHRCLFVGALVAAAIGVPLAVLIPAFMR